MTEISSLYLSSLNQITDSSKDFTDSPEIVYEALGLLADYFGLVEVNFACLTAAVFRDGRNDEPLLALFKDRHQTVVRKTLTDLRALASAPWETTEGLLSDTDHDTVRLFSALFLARFNVYQTANRRTEGLTDRRPVWEQQQLQEIIRIFGDVATKHSEPIAQAVSDKATALLNEAPYCYWRLDFSEETPELPEDVENLLSHNGMAWGRINNSLSYAFRTPTAYASFAASLAARLQDKARITKLISNNDIFVFEHWLNGHGFWTRMAISMECARRRSKNAPNWLTDSKN